MLAILSFVQNWAVSSTQSYSLQIIMGSLFWRKIHSAMQQSQRALAGQQTKWIGTTILLCRTTRQIRTNNLVTDSTRLRHNLGSLCRGTQVRTLSLTGSVTNSQTTMQAWEIDSYGGNDKFKLVEKPIPTITKPNQVLVKVHASSVNPIDVKMRGGYGARLLNKGRGVSAGGEFPLTLGRDCSGVVVNTGKDVRDFTVGQEVWATVNQISHSGAHAQYVLTTSGEMSAKPSILTHVEAASIPYVAITAWSAIYAVGRLRPENAVGQLVLVHGGAGGIGSFAIQLLRAWNCRVAATCSTDAVDLVSGLGAHCVVDYKTTNPETELKKLGRFDFILDTIGGPVEEYSKRLLNGVKGANYVTLVTPFIHSIDEKGALLGSLTASLTLVRKSIQFAKAGGKYRWAFAKGSSKALSVVADLVQDKKIRPVIKKVYPFAEVPEAFGDVEAGHARGKIVISLVEDIDLPQKKVDIFMENGN